MTSSKGQGVPAAALPSRQSARRVQLGPGLRRAWVGYQRRLDDALAKAGFADRALPDGRVLRLCSRVDDVTISQIGRELGVTRQRAGIIVAGLRDRRYVTVTPSPTSSREKNVLATPRAREYLEAQRKAARAIHRSVRAELGADAFAALEQLIDVLGAEDVRLRDYLSQNRAREI